MFFVWLSIMRKLIELFLFSFDSTCQDKEELQVNYPSMYELMHDLKGMAESNASWSRKNYLQRDTMAAAAAIYKGMVTIKKLFKSIFLILYFYIKIQLYLKCYIYIYKPRQICFSPMILRQNFVFFSILCSCNLSPIPPVLHVYISCIVKNAINVIAHIKSMNNIDIGSYKIWMKIMMPYTAPMIIQLMRIRRQIFVTHPHITLH